MKKIVLLLFLGIQTIVQSQYIKTFSDRISFRKAAAGDLVTEYFLNGPREDIGCQGAISADGNSCFESGAVVKDLIVRTSSTTNDLTFFYMKGSANGSRTVLVGGDEYAEHTVIEFPNTNVYSVGFEHATFFAFDRNIEIKVFGIKGLLRTVNTTTTGLKNGSSFFGVISNRLITSIEVRSLDPAGDFEYVGTIEFGTEFALPDPGQVITFFSEAGRKEQTGSTSTTSGTLDLFNIKGQDVYHIDNAFEFTTNSLRETGLPPGIYIARMEKDGLVQTRKVYVE